MSRVLFIVHGMGVHGADWATPTIAHLVDLPTKYGYAWFAANGALDTHVDLVPISYDGVFTQYLEKWSESSAELEKFATLHGVALPQFFKWLSLASKTEKNFFWSHVVDVLLYRLFQIVTAEVRLRIRLAIAKELTAQMDGGNVVDASVLAHSLGTSVAHDSLALLATQPIQTKKGENQAFMLGNFSFQNVFMVANVSRILETMPKVYESAVHPISVHPETSYTTFYCNFRHEYDPFPVIRPFKPEGWGDTYLHVEDLEHILAFNTHDLDHYLEDPRVHVPILRQLIDVEVVTDDEFDAAIAKYDATPEPKCPAALKAFKTDVQKLIAEYSASTDPQDILIAVIKALTTAKEAKDACG